MPTAPGKVTSGRLPRWRSHRRACTASFVAEETQYTTDGNRFAIRLETDPETGERYLTVLLSDLPEIVLTPAD